MGGAAGTSGEPGYGPVESTSAVKVAVVVRPLIDLEKQKKAKDIVTIEAPGTVKLPSTADSGEAQTFLYDRAYQLNSKEEGRRLFSELVQPLLAQFLRGFNSTVFAYGQTGSGKTYTMGTGAGLKDLAGTKEPNGVIPRAVKAVFSSVQEAMKEYDIAIHVTFVEIYNDEIRDLLVHTEGSSVAAPAIAVRESPVKGVYLDGIRELDVKTEADVAQLLEQGNSQRAVASHNLNETSSRSHAIFTISLDQRRKPSAPAVGAKLQLLRSKLHLVDLAGSERQKDTGASGQQLTEGININKGLLALGNVISALTESKERRHIPYRDSKLTRILQDSLGGTSETLMVACVSPADYNAAQTVSTLKYAARARNIQNQLRLHNKMSAEDEVLYLRKVLAERDDEIAALKERLAAAGSDQQPRQASTSKPASAANSATRQVAVKAKA